MDIKLVRHVPRTGLLTHVRERWPLPDDIETWDTAAADL